MRPKYHSSAGCQVLFKLLEQQLGLDSQILKGTLQSGDEQLSQQTTGKVPSG